MLSNKGCASSLMEIAVLGVFRPLAVAAIMLSALATASAADRVREFRGTGDATTAIFRVESPWLLDWRLDGDFDQLVALDVTLVEANSGKHIGRVLHTKRKGNGVKLFRSGGRYQLRISSSLARWTIKIDQLSAEEAELYVPK
ncbi:MAG: hypothetical protein WBM61_14170 [Woeseiaceae bacterium]|jgi:hypothetical protein